MDFLDRLDEEQQQNALLIARKAKQMGIEPRLAVALAYQESGLRMPKSPGGAGEIGIMQVKPTTAKMMGFDPKELDGLERNVEIGLTYLKQGLEKFNDPVLAVAGYNAGMDHPYFSNPEKSLPDSTKQYIKSINSMGAFSVPAPAETAAQAPVDVSEEGFQMDKARALVNLGGAAAGATVAKGMDIAKGVGETGKAMRDIAMAMRPPAGGGAAPTIGPVGGPAGPVAPGMPPSLGPDTRTPAGGRGTYNWAKAFGADELEARTATGMSEARQMQKQADVAKAKIAQIAPEMAPVPERGGLYLPQQTGAGPRGARTAPIPPVQPPAPPPAPGALQRIGSAVSSIPGAVLRSPMVSGALGGLGATEMGMQAAERYSANDPIGAAIAGVGAGGGALSMAPHPIPRAIGMGLAAASPLTLYLYDKMRQTSPEAAQRMLTNVDPMGNPMP